MENKIIIDRQAMLRALARISHEIIEQNTHVDTVCLIGIKKRGVPLAKMLKANITLKHLEKNVYEVLKISGFTSFLKIVD